MSASPSKFERSAKWFSLVALAVVGWMVLAVSAAGMIMWWPISRDTQDRTEQTGVLEMDEQGSLAFKDGSDTLKLMTVQAASARGAVCNDGTPAKYYFRPGSQENQDKWVIFFKGGGGCSSEESCLARAQADKTLVSSNKYPSTAKEGGIFSANAEQNPDFHDWNMVKIMYCSSDNFIGDTERTIGGETWYFHGKDIATAVIEDLKDPAVITGANLSQATQVLVAGSSAGGGGAAHNIDDITAWVPQADVKGIIDSSWGLGLDPYVGQVAGVEEDRAELSVFANKQFDQSCLEANSGNLDICTTLANVYPFIETPVFIFINQFDYKKLEGLGVQAPIDEGERQWVTDVFLPALTESFEKVDDGLFAPKESFHTMLTSKQYFSTSLDGVTIQEAFTNWYFDRPGLTRLVE